MACCIAYAYLCGETTHTHMANKTIVAVIAVISLLLSATQATAGTINTDSLLQAQKREAHRIPRMMAGYTFSLNTAEETTSSHEIDFHWFFLKYMGVGMGMELDKYKSGGVLSSGGDYYFDYDDDDIYKVNFHPMLSFRSPTLWFSHDSSWGVMLRCDPGLVLSLPVNDCIWIEPNAFPTEYGVYSEGKVRVCNHGGKWLFWRLRTAVSFYNNYGMVSIGYSRTNYNIRYCRNNMTYKGREIYKRDHLSPTDCLFISVSVCF